MEGNLERWAAGAGEIGEMNRLHRDEREKPPEKEDQKEVEKDREKEKQGWEEYSQDEKERQKEHLIHFLESP